MGNREWEARSNPLDEFQEKVQKVTDFKQYLDLLAGEGFPTLVAYTHYPHEEQSETFDEVGFYIATTTANVLNRRAMLGLSNSPDTLLLDVNMAMLFPDEQARARVAQGLFFGFKIAGVNHMQIANELFSRG